MRGSFTTLANYHLNATHPSARYLTAWLRWFVDLGRGKLRERGETKKRRGRWECPYVLPRPRVHNQEGGEGYPR
jgi:hypothetical protein